MYQTHIVDISADELAILGSLATSPQQAVQLVSGGDASITIPVLDGQSFSIWVAGKTYNVNPPSAVNVNVNINGNILIAGSYSANGYICPFYFQADVVWNSDTGFALYNSIDSGIQYSGGGSPNFISNTSQDYMTIASPSNFTFKVYGSLASGSDSDATLTVTEFRVLPN